MSAKQGWLVAVCVVVLLGACASIVAWLVWPEPEPPTADDVLTVLTERDPAQLSEPELDAWIQQVASTVDRLPPHELQELVQKAIADEKLRARFESLSPEQRQKMGDLISEEQRAQLMSRMATTMVQALKVMPKPLRDAALKQMRTRGRGGPGGGRGERRGGHPAMDKERLARWHSATTPRQRAEFVRAMREMRVMLEDAGIDR